MHSNIEKKRASRIFMQSTGKVSTYKCITKGIEFEHIIDYLLMTLCKLRTWETISLTFIDSDSTKRACSDTALTSAVLKMQRLNDISDVMKRGCSPEKD